MSGLRELVLEDGRKLPERLLEQSFSRASGPGGQNVNKVSSRVDLRLSLAGAVEFLGEADVAEIRSRLGSRVDKDDRIKVVCGRHRDQPQNIAEALSRLEGLLSEALERQKERIPTRPGPGVRRRRLEDKKRRGLLKQSRAHDGGDGL